MPLSTGLDGGDEQPDNKIKTTKINCFIPWKVRMEEETIK
jgi:hypothetical protein